MNAYKCDICGKYFENRACAKRVDAIGLPMFYGHHQLLLRIRDDNNCDSPLFVGDICPECMDHVCAELIKKGCADKTIKMYSEIKEAEEGGEF